MITFRRLGRFGRFGNQLFQYAGTRLYAELNGLKHAFPACIGNVIFEDVKESNWIENLKIQLLPTVQLDDVQSYGKVDKIKYLLGLKKRLPETKNIAGLHKEHKDNISLHGYLQDSFSLELLKNKKELVRKWFTFKKNI